MDYDRERVSNIFDDLGEVMFVLESDREYELHTGNAELNDDHMVAEGIQDGEYLVVTIPYDVIEHHYTHKAL